MGIRDVLKRFGRPVDIAAVRKLSLHLIVGEEDLDEDEIFISEADPLWMPGANDAGRNRIERIKTLLANLQANDVPVRLELVPGIKHQGIGDVVARTSRFLAEVLRQ
jgi:hypothetical protein